MKARTNCSVAGCLNPEFCRSWCAGHYERWRKHGSPLHGGELRPRQFRDPVCIMPDCDRPHQGGGYCGTHLYRVRKYGHPELPAKRTAKTPVDFFKAVMPEDPPSQGVIWPWRGSVNPDGYGIIHVGEYQARAHRVSYELFVGPIPEGLLIRHKNDTPIDVNPYNLEIGTLVDNVADRQKRSRQARGSAFGRSKLTEGSVYEARLLYAMGGYTLQVLADKFDVTKNTMACAIRGKTWKHVPMPH